MNTIRVVGLLFGLALLPCGGRALAQSFAPPAPATGPDALTTCLLQHTGDADKRALVRWIFLVVSKHPDVADMIQLDDAGQKRLDAAAAGVFERLMTEDCVEPLGATIRRSGTDAVGKSFELLGQAAMENLLQDPAVQAANVEVMKQVDLGKLTRALMRRQP